MDVPLSFKLNQAGRHHIPRHKHKVTNWTAYDAGLCQRGSLTVWFTDETIAAWKAPPRTGRGGQPWYSELAILTALTLRTVFRLAYGCVARIGGMGAWTPTPSRVRRCGHRSGVPAPACG